MFIILRLFYFLQLGLLFSIFISIMNVENMSETCYDLSHVD